jgi:hypothetical protein
MTPDDLVERVARELGAEPSNPLIRERVGAAIRIALEEAARVADRYEIPMCETSASHIAAAIRAMIKD